MYAYQLWPLQLQITPPPKIGNSLNEGINKLE